MARTASTYTNEIIDFLNTEAKKQGLDKTFSNPRVGNKFDLILSRDTDGRNGYAFLFVERETGGVYKTAGLKAPAKGERFNISTPEGRAKFTKVADPKRTSWLYLR